MKRTGRILPLKLTGDEPSLSEQTDLSGREPSLSGDHARAEEWREMTPEELEAAYGDLLLQRPHNRRFSVDAREDGASPERVREMLASAGWVVERIIRIRDDRDLRGDVVRFEGIIPDEVATQPALNAFAQHLVAVASGEVSIEDLVEPVEITRVSEEEAVIIDFLARTQALDDASQDDEDSEGYPDVDW